MSRTPEHDEQAALFVWARTWANHGTHAIPALRTLHASLNGVKLTPGQAKKAKAAGMLAGAWDVFLPYPAMWAGDQYGGLYIEMKYGRNGLTTEQELYREEVGGYFVWRVCRTWDTAARTILAYLAVPTTHPAWSGLEGLK